MANPGIRTSCVWYDLNNDGYRDCTWKPTGKVPPWILLAIPGNLEAYSCTGCECFEKRPPQRKIPCNGRNLLAGTPATVRLMRRF